MDIVPQPPSPMARLWRWLGEFDKALNAQPLDDLALRVAEIERRLPLNDRAEAPAKTRMAP